MVSESRLQKILSFYFCVLGRFHLVTQLPCCEKPKSYRERLSYQPAASHVNKLLWAFDSVELPDDCNSSQYCVQRITVLLSPVHFEDV